ncbi:hypothetical protein [Sphingomonas carotinifaciens]|uniref:Uncharacterized protein n=1 Tax=Sphingomonas carotinifaciens TaxID=1166323 RepID=A0A6N8LMZ6_9SPHN|nr:hypothetical protein [Sphingomonas carotinifaciens]MBB4087834.1 hypothetical protein [Sphingomonas carotinifaciens]MWC42330.1 hypothetical protein [Sphingomonas carotinifaciens]
MSNTPMHHEGPLKDCRRTIVLDECRTTRLIPALLCRSQSGCLRLTLDMTNDQYVGDWALSNPVSPSPPMQFFNQGLIDRQAIIARTCLPICDQSR